MKLQYDEEAQRCEELKSEKEKSVNTKAKKEEELQSVIDQLSLKQSEKEKQEAESNLYIAGPSRLIQCGEPPSLFPCSALIRYEESPFDPASPTVSFELFKNGSLILSGTDLQPEFERDDLGQLSYQIAETEIVIVQTIKNPEEGVFNGSVYLNQKSKKSKIDRFLLTLLETIGSGLIFYLLIEKVYNANGNEEVNHGEEEETEEETEEEERSYPVSSSKKEKKDYKRVIAIGITLAISVGEALYFYFDVEDQYQANVTFSFQVKKGDLTPALQESIADLTTEISSLEKEKEKIGLDLLSMEEKIKRDTDSHDSAKKQIEDNSEYQTVAKDLILLDNIVEKYQLSFEQRSTLNLEMSKIVQKMKEHESWVDQTIQESEAFQILQCIASLRAILEQEQRKSLGWMPSFEKLLVKAAKKKEASFFPSHSLPPLYPGEIYKEYMLLKEADRMVVDEGKKYKDEFVQRIKENSPPDFKAAAATELQKSTIVNLIWLNKQIVEDNTYAFPTIREGISIEKTIKKWLEEGWRVHFWINSHRVTEKQYKETQALFEEIRNGAPKGATYHLVLQDVAQGEVSQWKQDGEFVDEELDLRLIKKSFLPKFFYPSADIPIYLQADLVRLCISYNDLIKREGEALYSLYADIDVKPPPIEDLFSDENQLALEKIGLLVAMDRSKALGMENAFHIIKKNNEVLEAVRMFIRSIIEKIQPKITKDTSSCYIPEGILKCYGVEIVYNGYSNLMERIYRQRGYYSRKKESSYSYWDRKNTPLCVAWLFAWEEARSLLASMLHEEKSITFFKEIIPEYREVLESLLIDKKLIDQIVGDTFTEETLKELKDQIGEKSMNALKKQLKDKKKYRARKKWIEGYWKLSDTQSILDKITCGFWSSEDDSSEEEETSEQPFFITVSLKRPPSKNSGYTWEEDRKRVDDARGDDRDDEKKESE